MSKITVSRALVQLKLTDDKIVKAVNKFAPTTTKVGKKLRVNETEEEFQKRVKEELQSITALLELRKKLKDGIIQSNAITKLKVGNEDMTVAQAIEKKSSIVMKEALLTQIRKNFDASNITCTNENIKIQTRLDDQAKVLLGKDVKKESTEYSDFVSTFLKNNEYTLVDPLKVLDVLKKMESEVEDFKSNVDIALTESNATTSIEV